MPYPSAPPPRGHDMRDFVVFVVLAALILGALSLVATLLPGCGSSQAAIVAPAVTANNRVADALAIAERLEFARLRTLVNKGFAACVYADTSCRLKAVDEAFASEKPRIDAINKSIATQHIVAEALTQFQACGKNGGDVQACEADALVRLEALAPQLAQLITDVREELKSP